MKVSIWADKFDNMCVEVSSIESLIGRLEKYYLYDKILKCTANPYCYNLILNNEVTYSITFDHILSEDNELYLLAHIYSIKEPSKP